MSIRRQCELLGVARCGVYRPPTKVSAEDLSLMKRIDEQYTKTPYYGSRRMAAALSTKTHPVNRKPVQRLMRLMGIEAIYPRCKLSAKNPDHHVYPYLLRGLVIDRPDQVWSSDITYVRMRSGFAYLMAILDWYSRYVVAWRLSNTMDVNFCVEALEDALSRPRRPMFHNSDQGSQFTSATYTDLLKSEEILISMDGRGRVFDNIFVERLWRSVKYEEVYIMDYDSMAQARRSLGLYFMNYNIARPHQALDYKTPEQVYKDCAPATAIVMPAIAPWERL
jgi:putative transposase